MSSLSVNFYMLIIIRLLLVLLLFVYREALFDRNAEAILDCIEKTGI